MDRGTQFTIIMTAGMVVSIAGIYHEAVNKSDMAGAGLFLLQGVIFLLHYLVRTGRMRRK
jgi:hypothetical protein